MSSSVGQVAVIPGARGIVTYLICKITGSHSHHMVVITGDNECVSADPEGVTVQPLSAYPTVIVSKFVMTGEQTAQVAAFAKAQVGKPYAFLDDALIALERIFRFRFPDWVRERFADDGQWQCAELADAALAAAGVTVFDDGRRIGDVFPGSYEAEFIKRGWYTAKYFRTFPLIPW